MKQKFTFQFLFFLLFAGIISGYAQQPIYFGVKAGIGIPNLQSGSSSTPVSSGYSSRLGPYFGVFGDFHLTKTFSIQPEINYSSQGGKKDGQQAIDAREYNPSAPAGTYFYANYKSVARLNYIEIPILAKFTFPFGKNWAFTADAGPYFGFLAGAKNITSGSSYVYQDQAETMPITPQPVSFDTTEDIKDQLHTGNIGVQANVGLSMNCKMGYLFFEVGGNYGFMNIQKNSENGENHTGAATIVLGYAFRLNGK